MTRTDRALLVGIYFNIADALITLPHWHLEGNPVVLQLGLAGMFAVKLSLSAGLALCWFRYVKGEWTERFARPIVWAFTALYATVVTSNLGVLILA